MAHPGEARTVSKQRSELDDANEIVAQIGGDQNLVDSKPDRPPEPPESDGLSTQLRPDSSTQTENDLRDRLDKLQAAADKASGHVRNLYLFFLSFGLYLAIIFGSTTHEQLLRESPITLPLFDVELPLRGFYWVAPALFVLLHFNLLVQCYLLAGKLKRLDNAFRELGAAGQGVERARLDVFPFTQMLLGDHRSPLARRLPTIMAWATIVVAPVGLLLFGQASFLPYHDAATTWWHRTLVVLDLASVWLLWSIATDLSGRWRRRLLAWPRLVRCRATSTVPDRSLPVAIFVSGSSRVLDLDRWFGAPIRVYRRHISQRRAWRPLLLEKLAPIAVALAFLLLIIPGEFLARPLDRLVGERGGFGLSRNLVVRETNLVGSWPTQAQIDQYGEDLAWQNFGAPPNLRGRDLRYADLSQSIFVRGDFRGANLKDVALDSANLQGAILERAEIQGADLTLANLQGAALGDADARGASLRAANLQDGKLRRANFGGADLAHANLQGAGLVQANLQGAVLWGTSLQGAVLGGAKLQGAALSLANLQGAYLGGDANLQGASLNSANLQGVDLIGTNLQGADLRGADLRGVDLRIADLRGVDLRGVNLWRARLDEKPGLGDHWVLADLREVSVDPVENPDAWIEEAAQQITEEGTRLDAIAYLQLLGVDIPAIAYEGTRRRVSEQLRVVLRDDDRLDVPSFPGVWQSAPNVMFEPTEPLPQRLGWGPPRWATEDAYDEDLAQFLGELACGENATMHVAEGVARRAHGDRLYAKLLAERLLGDDCPPAAGLPGWRLDGLRRLAETGVGE